MPESHLLHYLTLWGPLGYGIIFFGMVIEGDAVLFATAFLVHEGFFGFWPAVLVSFSGVLIGDILWYFLGVRLKDSPSFIARSARHIASSFDEHIKKQPFRAVFVSKFMYGLHHQVLMRFGMLGRPLGLLVREDVAASAVWFLIIGSLGFFFSASIMLIRRYLRLTEFALLFGLVFFLALKSLANNALKKGL
jgi:membrane protein DedA with SNARE-associated domain